MSKIVTRADAHLAGQLGIPVGEFHRLAFRAGADALRRRYEERSELKFPLRLVVEESPPPPAGDTLPVHLPRGMVLMLREIVEDAAELSGGISDYVTQFPHQLLIDAIDHCDRGDGIIADIRDGYDLTDPEATLERVAVVVKRWEYADGVFRRKGDNASPLPKPAKLPVLLPAGLVTLLRLLVEEIGCCAGGLEGYLADNLSTELTDSIKEPTISGIICMLPDIYNFGDDEESIVARMQSEISKWEVVDGLFRQKEEIAV